MPGPGLGVGMLHYIPQSVSNSSLTCLDLETGPGYLEDVSVSQGDEFLFVGNNSLEMGKERAIWSI